VGRSGVDVGISGFCGGGIFIGDLSHLGYLGNMKIIADFHLHSKYSRAVSEKMILPEIARWAKLKGLDLVGTADWTHPVWVRELKSQLKEAAPGVFRVREGKEGREGREGKEGEREPLFLLVTEIASIYSQKGRTYKIHNLVLAPDFEAVEKINAELTRRGVNLIADGRPITGISARDLAELIFSIDEKCVIIPAHVWTPWFSLYGSNSGFDSLEECFGDLAKSIYAIETGLSSDPEMNWRIGELDNRQIVSFSDAHSGANLGREATVFALSENRISNFQFPISKISYKDITSAIKNDSVGKLKIAYTIEFYPQEGKYHYTGHRNCQVRQSPEETKKLGKTCPVCGKPLTVGVLHRVEQLSNRTIEQLDEKIVEKTDQFGVKQIKWGNRPGYVMLVPLAEIIAKVKGVGKLSKSVMEGYVRVIRGIREIGEIRGELGILLEAPLEEIAKVGGEKLAEGISRVRAGEVHIEPGYDGVYGEVKVWPAFAKASAGKPEKEQMSLF